MRKKLCFVFYCLLVAISVSVADEDNGLEQSQDIENYEQDNKSNAAQYAIECNDEPRLPEHVVNCELLIAGLKADSAINRNELCCTLLSSRATKSMCCQQIRDLCGTNNGSQCPKNRRRIKPPRSMESKSKKLIEEKVTTVDPVLPLFIYKMKKQNSVRL